MILILQSFEWGTGLGLASWLEEARKTSRVARAMALMREPPFSLLFFNFIWWSIFMRSFRAQYGSQSTRSVA